MGKIKIHTHRALVSFITVLTLLGVISSTNATTLALEEITVTARKREVTLQDAAIAVSVVSGADFDRSNIVKLDNFNGYTPGLIVAKNDGAGRVVTIRGIGWETAQNIASQPSVLTYIDGIYLANPLSMGLDLGELERVEVFRGPQGTEFGQGTTGGAINLVTKKPVLGEASGYAEFGYGTFNTTNARGAVNFPLGDRSAIRASIQKYDHDGFAEIKGGALDGYDLDDADSITGKVSWLFEPTENFSILAQGFIHDSDQHAAAQKNIDDPNPDPRKLTQDFPGIFKLENKSVSLTMEWETPIGVTIKSLTGYQKLKKRQSEDGDRLTEATVAIDRLGFFSFDNWDVLPFWDNDSKAFSQEINATYNSDKLDWVVGAYYLDHDNFNDFLEATAPAPFSASAAALENPSVANLPPFASALNFNETRTVAREDLAIYAQATYRFTDMYAVTGGVRYQDEKQRDFGTQFFGIFGGFDRDTNDSKVTWKVGADVNLTENNMIYGLVSTGWKNGGTNPGAITGGAIFLDAAFKPEEVTSYEIGSRNTFMDGRLRLNITAFYYDHEHLQYIFEDPVPFGGGTNTIPKLEEYGVETEFSFKMAEDWQLDGMFAWQDGKFKGDTFALDPIDFREALGPGVGLFTGGGFGTRFGLATTNNLNGNEPPKLPSIMARLSLTNTYAFSDGAVLSSRVEYLHRGEMQSRVFNNPLFDTVPSYDVVNLNFAYDMANRPVTFNLVISNVFDEDGINNVFNNPFGIWSTSNEYIPPREVIGSVRYSWD
ncbi:MAG: iron complex outermembrane receptor protein [Planctomycetota bacterium]|jgi:iron complex outermembrane receptor protein